MPYPSKPCGRAISAAIFYPLEHPTLYAYVKDALILIGSLLLDCGNNFGNGVFSLER
jgi:hypothetical protein